MEVTGTHVLPVGREAAWRALNDVTLMRQAIPGCDSMVAVDGEVQDGLPTAYDVVVAAAVGPIKARFRGTLRVTDLDPPHAYVLHFEGGTGFVGSASGRAAVRLEAADDATTRLVYTATASAAGRLAKVGPAVIDRAARHLIDHFFGRFAAALSGGRCLDVRRP